MKNKIMIIIIINLLGCGFLHVNNENTTEDIVLKSEIWKSVNGQVWSNYEVWAGEGIYFYEKNGQAFCDYIHYGSGVYVASLYSTPINIEDNELLIELNIFNKKNEIHKTEILKCKLIGDDQLMIEERIYQKDSNELIKYIEEYKEVNIGKKE